MKKWIGGLLAASFLSLNGLAQAPVTQPKVQVMLLGTFHFDNPGLDVAKYESANILSAKRQQEVLEVVKQLEAFKPDQIFIEVAPQWQGHYDSLLQAYKNGTYTLKAGETDQLGFRLAKVLGLPQLQCVDYRDANFPFDSLVKVITAEKQYDLLAYMKRSIDSIQAAHNHLLKTATLKEILLANNTKADREFSVGGYFEFLKAGGRNNHVGAYLVSEWWRRNMVIYQNILKRLTGKEKRVLVIFGGSHTALLEAFMKYNPAIELVEVGAVLR